MNAAAPDLQDLYRRTIKGQAALFSQRRPPAIVTHRCEGSNPNCGDHLALALHLEDVAIAALGFEGESCLICRASAVMMADTLAGATVAQAHEFSRRLDAFLHDGQPLPGPLATTRCLEGVRAYPSRLSCALLPWQTLTRCIQPDPTYATTHLEAKP